MAAVPDRLSQALAGRYRIERDLGAGGDGEARLRKTVTALLAPAHAPGAG